MSTRQTDAFVRDRSGPGHHSWRSATLINQQPQDLQSIPRSPLRNIKSLEASSQSHLDSDNPPNVIPPRPHTDPSLRQIHITDHETDVDVIGRSVSTPDPLKSAKKLARMGYPVEATSNPRPPAQQPAQSKRLGASIKSFVQSIRGKTA